MTRTPLKLLPILFFALAISGRPAAQDPVIPSADIQRILDKTVDGKNVFGAVICVQKGEERQTFAAGDAQPDSPYFIASVTKLYTAAIVFKLADQGRLELDAPIARYLPPDVLEGLHVFKGRDYSDMITVRHLLSNTSGLPDYFEDKKPNGESIMEHIRENRDTALSFEGMMKLTKAMEPKFAPAEPEKAHYSDGNFQLLGRIIERQTGLSMSEAFEQFIFEPLHLENTYLYSDPQDTRPLLFYYKDQPLHIPHMMVSFAPDGAIVSTTEENMIFLRAFFRGELFEESHLKRQTWNKMYGPFTYGIGLARFNFPGAPEMLGHPGASGAFAYYIPAKDVYLTGTINQVHKPQRPYQMLIRILKLFPDSNLE